MRVWLRDTSHTAVWKATALYTYTYVNRTPHIIRMAVFIDGHTPKKLKKGNWIVRLQIDLLRTARAKRAARCRQYLWIFEERLFNSCRLDNDEAVNCYYACCNIIFSLQLSGTHIWSKINILSIIAPYIVVNKRISGRFVSIWRYQMISKGITVNFIIF